MTNSTITQRLIQSYDVAVAAVRGDLGDQGFGVLTEIDPKAVLKDKLDVDVDPQVIIGACRPPLAYEAIQAESSIAAVLPCNVVVRALDQDTTLVEAFDPNAMMRLADNAALKRSRATPNSVLERPFRCACQDAVNRDAASLVGQLLRVPAGCGGGGGSSAQA